MRLSVFATVNWTAMFNLTTQCCKVCYPAQAVSSSIICKRCVPHPNNLRTFCNLLCPMIKQLNAYNTAAAHWLAVCWACSCPCPLLWSLCGFPNEGHFQTWVRHCCQLSTLSLTTGIPSWAGPNAWHFLREGNGLTSMCCYGPMNLFLFLLHAILQFPSQDKCFSKCLCN